MIDKLFKKKSDDLLIQLFRYIFVGGLAFLVDFGLLYFFTEYLHIYYLISASMSFIIGLVVNYLLSIKWVFGNRQLKNRTSEFVVFGVIGLVGLGLNALIIWLLTDFASVYYLISKIISTVLVFLFNFFARRYLLFNKGDEGSKKGAKK